MQQLLTESTLLSVISGTVALVTVLLLKDAIVGLAPADIPRLNEVDISAGVLIFAFAVSVVTGVAFGLLPAFQAAAPIKSKICVKAAVAPVLAAGIRASHASL